MKKDFYTGWCRHSGGDLCNDVTGLCPEKVANGKDAPNPIITCLCQCHQKKETRRVTRRPRSTPDTANRPDPAANGDVVKPRRVVRRPRTP